MALISNLSYILIGFVALVSIFLVVLTVLEKKLHLKFLRGKYARNEFYIEKIAKLNISKPVESLGILNNLAKGFFREAFHIKGSPEYSQLELFFKKRNNKKATEFSRKMTIFLYSKEPITKEQLQELVRILAEIISSNKIISREEQKDLDKKSQQDQTFLRKVHIPGISKKKLNHKKN